jgi:hypothetical protein
LSEGKIKLSYPLFCQLRPFWVLFPTESDRNTCLCKLWEYIELKAKALIKSNVLKENTLEDILKERVCDEKSINCMNSICTNCQDRHFNINERDFEQKIIWCEWKNKREKRSLNNMNGKEKIVSSTVKETITPETSELLHVYERDCKLYMKHLYNCWRQYRYFN